ncbi:DUF262 domain-containing protein [Candidatus Albibeggiatoa sp. nov. NOAA]|uniref:DUF262 domain-containing protein n=1 Tax=Candidatus Albibeggiatoa sp. nov. NOAA TaxID=3162724 RepID=UPI0033033434|nr:hypothetical protein [Thiotrichaceae bacterium]
MDALEYEIREKQARLHVNSFDMTFGRLIDLYDAKHFIIPKEYQDCMSWSIVEQTCFIEHLLLGFPTRPIFVVENSQHQWELIEGVQRVLTIFSLFGRLTHMPDQNAITLIKGQFIEGLEGVNIENMPNFIEQQLKEKSCHIDTIRWDSDIEFLGEVFKQSY